MNEKINNQNDAAQTRDSKIAARKRKKKQQLAAAAAVAARQSSPQVSRGKKREAEQGNEGKRVQKHLAEHKQAAAKVKQIKAAAAKVPADYEAAARKRRRKRTIRLIQKLVIFVVAPTIAAAIYYGHYAKDQYQSISAVAVQTEGKGGLGIESVIGTFAATGSSKDAMTVQEYILSRDMLQLLEKDEHFIRHCQQPWIDVLSRLPSDATFEDAFEYYQEMVEANFNAESGVLTLQVKAFHPKIAQRFSKAILLYAEEKVNQLSRKMQQDKITFTENVVKTAEKRLSTAQQAILALQKEQADFSPDHSAQALMGVKNQLEGQLALAQTELDQMLSAMAPTAPQVIALKQKVQSIRNQIRKENKRLLGTEDGGLGTNMAEFEMAMLEKQFAQKEYESSMVSLELARLEAMKQTRYLAEISSPSLPDEATFPKRGLKVLTVFLVSLAIFGIFSLLLSAVKEHARI